VKKGQALEGLHFRDSQLWYEVADSGNESSRA
jgi:hypothetical protein